MERAPRVCPRCGVANDPIFQYCRACSTDLDDPPDRYVQEPPAQNPASAAYSPFTTPYNSVESAYSVKSTPFSAGPEPHVDGEMPPGAFAPPQGAFPFSPGADAPYPPQPQPPLYAAQPFAQQPFADGYAGQAFDQPAALLYDEQPLLTAKRARRRLKWLLNVLLTLLAFTLLASGVFAYLDRLSHSEKPLAITDMGLE